MKIIKLILVLLCLVGCTSNNQEDNNSTQDNIVVDKGEISTIKTNKIYEDKQIIITVNDSQLGFVDTSSFNLNLTVQNKTNHELVVVAETVMINGIFLEQFNLLNETIEPKKSIDYSWLFEDYMYKRHNFTTIGSISFEIIKYETVNGDYKVSRTEMIHIETEHKDYVQEINSEGKVLIDEQGYKIVAQEAQLKEFGEKEYYCWFYLENNSDQDAAFQIKKVSVNGYVIKSQSNPRFIVPKDSKGYYNLTFTSDDIEKYKLDPIDRMYVELAVVEDLDAHSYGKEIVKTQSFGIYYNE